MTDTKEARAPTEKVKAKAKAIRPLGYLERFEAALHSLDLYRSSMVTCRFTIPPSLVPEPGPAWDDRIAILKRTVESAIALVVLEHPLLRVGLRNEHARKPVFVELESVDFRNHVEWKILDEESADYERDLVTLIRDRLDVKVESPETKPAWRMLVLHIKGTGFVDIIGEWGHAHIDGMSMKLFHETILENLNKLDETEPSLLTDRVLLIPVEKRRDLLPPLHGLCEFPITKRWAASTLWNELKPPALKNSDLLSSGWAPMLATPYVVQYRHFSLDNDTLQNLLAVCRKHKTTLTGLFQTLATFSLATRLSPEKARGFRSSTVVNLRPIMSSEFLQSHNIDPMKTMGNLVTTVEHDYDVDLVTTVRQRAAEGEDMETHSVMAVLDELVWSTSVRVRGELQKRLDDGTKNDQMGLIKFIPDYRSLLKDWLKQPRVFALHVTNLGVIDGDPPNTDVAEAKREPGDQWTIDRAIFSISPEVHNGAFCVCPVAVKGRELYVSLSWQKGVVDKTLADGLVADLESWLRYLGRQTQ
ncbi:alcohol acetyltransferase-domain-containing protein [Hypoxylon sp. FL1284]|nr:alcohol acetyltransferase-domain-containing protein [Hypoxylon sp. FL1284]